MSTVSRNGHRRDSGNGSTTPKSRQLELLFPPEDVSLVAVKGSGTLAAYSMKFAILEVGTATPINIKQRSRFKNYGVVAISDAPVDIYGRGPHFILVEIPDKIEEPKLESRAYGKCIHTPVAIVGASLASCEPPQWLNRGEWVNALVPRNNRQIRKGRIIGYARTANNCQDYSVDLDRSGNPIIIIPPTLFFESPYTLELKNDDFVSPFTEEASKDWIMLVRSIPNKDLRIIYPARVNQNSLVIPSLTLNALKASCNLNEDKDDSEDVQEADIIASNFSM